MLDYLVEQFRHLLVEAQEHGVAQVTPLPKYESLVATYREYHKKHGRDADHPYAKAPIMKDDVALMKRLFPEGGVPEKTLRSIRHDVWGDRIKRGRPRK